MSTLFHHSQRFSIRKYAVGVASVLVGTALLAGAQSVSADEVIAAQPEVVQVESTEQLKVAKNLDTTEPAIEGATAVVEEVSTVAVTAETTEIEQPQQQDPSVSEVAAGGAVESTKTIAPVTEDIQSANSLSQADKSVIEKVSVLDSEMEKGPTTQSLFRSAARNSGTLAPSGTYYFSGTAGIKAEPKISSPDLASYSAGQSVNYDRVLESDGHQWISYIAYSGNRRYIAVKALPKQEQPAPTTPSLPGYTLTFGYLSKDGIAISTVSTQVTDKSKLSYAVWSDEKGQDDLKWYNTDSTGRATAAYTNHKHYGVYHIHTYVSENGAKTKIAERTITIPSPNVTSTVTKVNETTFDITVSNVPFYMHSIKIPVWSDKGSQDDLKWYSAIKQDDKTYKLTVTTANHKNDTGIYHAHLYGKSSLEENRTIGLGATAGFTVAAPKVEVNKAPDIPSSGSYTFTSRVSVKNEPKVSAPELAFYNAGQSVNYDSKLVADGQQWISYINYSGGRSYIAIGSASSSAPSVPSTPISSPAQPKPSTPNLTSPNARPHYAENTYPHGECTWGAKTAARWVNNHWGHAKNWITAAQSDGFRVGDVPVVGAVAVWPNTGWYNGELCGHVGVVTEVVNNNLIRVIESNIDGKRYPGDHQGLFNPTNPYTGGIVKYIYPPA